MIHINIPGGESLQLSHVVMDYNGTLAGDGELITGVETCLQQLAGVSELHVISADIHGSVAKKLAGLPVKLHIIKGSNQDRQKVDIVYSLGSQGVVAVGNGANDYLMLKRAVLGIGLIQTEGAALKTLLTADIICTSIVDALNLLINQKRLQATLKN